MSSPTDAPAIPDVESQESDGLLEDVEESGDKNWWDDRTLKTRVTQGVAIACAVLHLVSIIWESAAAAVVIAGILGIGLSVAVFYFQLQLQEEDTLRMVQNQLRHQVNRLFSQNKQLATSNNRLEVQVTKLKVQETKLAAIADEQGTNVQNLVGLVKENQTTLDGLKQCLKADTEQMFLKAVLDSDWDSSNDFSDQEVQMLEYRLQSLKGVSVNKKLLKSKVQATDRSLASILGLLSEMDNEALPDEERIFVFHEETLAKQ